MQIEHNASLARYTTYRIGGTCAVMVFPEGEEDFPALRQVIGDKPYLILGNGSNILFADDHFEAVVVNLTKWTGVIDVGIGRDRSLQIRSGTHINTFMHFVQTNNIAHYDFLAGIPGTIGGAVYMNAGAWGKSIGDLVLRVRIFDLLPNNFRDIEGEQLLFSYRKQNFLKPGQIITEVTLKAQDRDGAIGTKIAEVLQKRRDKHPSQPSCGSVFKNLPDISAGSLIESCGLKGSRIGDAQISDKHANFIVNLGHATFADVTSLIALTQAEVEKKHGKMLESEVKIIETCENHLFHSFYPGS